MIRRDGSYGLMSKPMTMDYGGPKWASIFSIQLIELDHAMSALSGDTWWERAPSQPVWTPAERKWGHVFLWHNFNVILTNITENCSLMAEGKLYVSIPGSLCGKLQLEDSDRGQDTQINLD